MYLSSKYFSPAPGISLFTRRLVLFFTLWLLVFVSVWVCLCVLK